MYIGKFAQICQTAKDTLWHYDEINLLKPVSVSESGYKVYSAVNVNPKSCHVSREKPAILHYYF